MLTELVEEVLNIIGITAFAFSGAVLGVRKQFDIVGMAVLATATALGGGLIRDALIGATPAAALTNPWWLLLPLLATVITFIWHPQVQRLRRGVMLFDAVGLGVFCATATAKASAYGVTPLAAVLLGTITGVGGGVLRDILAGTTPSVLRKDSRLYAVPAVGGCAVVAVAAQFATLTIWWEAAGAAVIVLVRLLALRFGWTAPVPRVRFADPG